MFNIGAGEMVLIVVAALLVLGPQRLPELARAIGKFMREFRRQTDEVRTVVEREFYTMDQDLQKPPPARATTPVPMVPSAPVGTGEPGVLPPKGELPPAAESAPALAEGTAAPGEELEPAVPGEGESSTPTFAPLPGTVARNAPKRS